MAASQHPGRWLVLIAGLSAWALALTLGLSHARRDDPRPPSLESLMEQQRYEEAIAQLRWMLARAPSTQHLTHNLIGNAYLAQRRYEAAIRHYRDALAGAPEFPDAHNNLGVALARSGRPVEAMLEFEEALRVRPDYTEARNNLSRLVKNYGAQSTNDPRDPEAQAALRRARRLLEEAGATPRTVVEGDAETLGKGRDYLRLFHAGDLAELHGNFTQSFASEMPLEGLYTLLRGVEQQLGTESEILRERASLEGDGRRLYVRWSRFAGFAGLVEQSVAMDREGSIAGLRVRTMAEP